MDDGRYLVLTVVGDDYGDNYSCGQPCPQYDQRGQENLACQTCERTLKTRPDEYK